jgi:hypothetical protein
MRGHFNLVLVFCVTSGGLVDVGLAFISEYLNELPASCNSASGRSLGAHN